jgi:hypothetical protein
MCKKPSSGKRVSPTSRFCSTVEILANIYASGTSALNCGEVLDVGEMDKVSPWKCGVPSAGSSFRSSLK